jgi:hypothetical protein
MVEIEQLFADQFSRKRLAILHHRIIIFSVEKFKADGMLDKFKSLMVANGNGQDPKVYLDRSSPMVVVHSILTCLCMAV